MNSAGCCCVPAGTFKYMLDDGAPADRVYALTYVAELLLRPGRGQEA